MTKLKLMAPGLFLVATQACENCRTVSGRSNDKGETRQISVRAWPQGMLPPVPAHVIHAAARGLRSVRLRTCAP